MIYEPWPLDFRLLELMPNVGLVAGVHNAGRSAVALRDAINEVAGEDVVTSSQVSARLRVMRMAGLCDSAPATGNQVWARTALGVQMLEQGWEAVQRTNGNPPDQPVGEVAQVEGEGGHEGGR